MKQLILPRGKMLNQFPVTLTNRSGGNSAEKMRGIERVMPGQKVAINFGVSILPFGERRNAVQCLLRIHGDPGGIQNGGIKVGVHRRSRSDGFALNHTRPFHEKRDTNAAFV